jgi:putative resolvase
MLGVGVQTLRAREKSGELIPDRRSRGGVRYYDVGKITGLGNEDRLTVGYAAPTLLGTVEARRGFL